MARVVMDVFWCDVVPLLLWLSVWLVEAGSDEASAEDSPLPSTVSKQLQPKQYSEANRTEDRQVLHIIELSEAPRFRHKRSDKNINL